LRLNFGWITALLRLLVLTPAIVAAIRAILNAHNLIEEGPGGLYEQCENLAGAEVEQILAQLRSARAVKVAPHVDASTVIEATRRALAKAGYDLES
jgi:hypothetical protein